MLFLYGTRKPFMFHSPGWAASLERSDEHRVVGLRAGHWVMRDRPDEFCREVDRWLGGDG
jgi:pimeloyl-ACP methyl ester carboxylesterase